MVEKGSVRGTLPEQIPRRCPPRLGVQLMLKCKRTLLVGTILAGIVYFGTAPPARAEFKLRILVDGVQSGQDVSWSNSGQIVDPITGTREIDINSTFGKVAV